jgi:hypothetical protein
MVDGDEDRGLNLSGQGRGQIAAPYRVYPHGRQSALPPILASPNTLGHSAKARLVVTMTEVRS